MLSRVYENLALVLREGTIIALLLMVLYCPSGCSDGEVPSAPASSGVEKEFKKGPATLKLTLDRTELTIAEHLKLGIELQVAEDYKVKLPDFGEKLEQFGIVDYHSRSPKLIEDGKISYRKDYVLEPFLSGTYSIPVMTASFWKEEEKEKVHQIESEAIEIIVKSILPETLAERTIKDIAPPVSLPSSFSVWILATGAVIILVVMAIVIILWRRKRNKNLPSSKRSAHDIAFDALEALLAEKLVEQNKIKLFYIGLSSVLRQYIENRFALRAPERTTEEFLSDLRSTKILSVSDKVLLKSFLRHCDMVKFAKHRPSDKEIEEAFDLCKNFILETAEQDNSSGDSPKQEGASDNAL